MAQVHRRMLAAALIAVLTVMAGPGRLGADIPPYPGGKRFPRPECGLVNRVDRVTTTRMPRPAVAASGVVFDARKGSPSLQFLEIAGAGTPRATVVFEWMACGYPGRRGPLVRIRSSTDVPGNPGPEIRYVMVKSASNAIIVRL